MTHSQPVRILFVCTGNICRSPMAEAIFIYQTEKAGLKGYFEIASAATTSWEVGERPHPGTQLVLRKNKIPLSPNKRAVQITNHDYQYYNYILAMDGENLRYMHQSPKIRRLLEFAPPGNPIDVPDPYYTGDFDYVFSLLQAACQNLLAHIRVQEQF